MSIFYYFNEILKCIYIYITIEYYIIYDKFNYKKENHYQKI